MDKHISKCCERSPLNIRMRGFEIVRKSLGRFSHSVEISQGRILVELRSEECILARPGHTLDPINHVEDVFQVCLVVFTVRLPRPTLAPGEAD